MEEDVREDLNRAFPASYELIDLCGQPGNDINITSIVSLNE